MDSSCYPVKPKVLHKNVTAKCKSKFQSGGGGAEVSLARKSSFYSSLHLSPVFSRSHAIVFFENFGEAAGLFAAYVLGDDVKRFIRPLYSF
jgi:hypothetical protein